MTTHRPRPQRRAHRALTDHEATTGKAAAPLSRSEARIFTSIWKDEDFLALPPGAQRLYLFLLSQDDLAYCGVLPLRQPRWARKAKGLTVAGIEAGLAVLAEGPRPFVVVDEDTGELLVRSLIRHDGIWKQPNIMKAARESAGPVESPAIRAALLAELERIPAAESGSRAVRAAHAEFVNDLRKGSPNPSPNPSGNPSPNPPGNPRLDGSGKDGYPQGGFPQAAGEPHPAGNGTQRRESASPQASAPSNPSGNPLPDPSQGGGDGYGPVLQVVPSPYPLTPSPRGSGQPPLLNAVTDLQPEEGEGESPGQGRTPQAVAALTGRLRAARPDWSTASIRRALDDPSVLERPWPLVCAAALAVAADPKSQHPGRLAHDGPWWRAETPPATGTPKPPWCGECSEDRRWLDADSDHPRKCPRCHPDLVKARPA